MVSEVVALRGKQNWRGASHWFHGVLENNLKQTLLEFINDDAVLSNSWGPPDDKRVATLGLDMKRSINSFAKTARNGKGGIMVWAAGNGGPYDNVNDDGFASDVNTIAVSSVGMDGRRARYAEYGTCIDVSVPGGHGNMLTTDLMDQNGYHPSDFTSTFDGTSAATPIVSGIVALILTVRPNATFQDVRDILVQSATKTDESEPKWIQNAAGTWYSPWYGFGVVNAARAVELATTWVSQPLRKKECTQAWNGKISFGSVMIPLFTEEGFSFVQTVTLDIGIKHAWRGDVIINVTSSSGTSISLTQVIPRTVDVHHANFVPHTYSVHAFHGETVGNGLLMRCG